MGSLTLNKNKKSPYDKYPNYDPQHWYLSVIKPLNSRYIHEVSLRPLLSVPSHSTVIDIAGSLLVSNLIYGEDIFYRSLLIVSKGQLITNSLIEKTGARKLSIGNLFMVNNKYNTLLVADSLKKDTELINSTRKSLKKLKVYQLIRSVGNIQDALDFLDDGDLIIT